MRIIIILIVFVAIFFLFQTNEHYKSTKKKK